MTFVSGMRALDLAQNVDPVLHRSRARHLDVENRDVGFVLVDQTQSRDAASSAWMTFSTDIDLGEHCGKQAAHNRGIVHDQDGEASRHGSSKIHHKNTAYDCYR